MSGYKKDIRKVDVVIAGDFGNYTFRNWGDAGTSISIESIEANLYNEKVGANGDMLLSKSYKPSNKLVKLNVLPKSADYIFLQKLVALEESGSQNVFICTVKDNNTGESYVSDSCVLKTAPAVSFGDNIDGGIEYQILMPSAVHIVK